MTSKPKGSDSETRRKKPVEADETAQRILNLFFVLDTSAQPLTTEQIVRDSDLGYGSSNIASDKKKFQRDRAKLLAHGIVVREIKSPGANETEESSWTIDRGRTFAAGGLITPDDADLLDGAITQALDRGTTPFATPLVNIRTKLEHLGAAPTEASETAASPAADAVWSAFALKKGLRFEYSDAAGCASKRSVCIYGIFDRDGHGYFCGLDDKSGAVRTFRIDRIRRARATGGEYEVPADFNLRDYLFLDFDLGQGEAVNATFSFPHAAPAGLIDGITLGRGAVSHDDTAWTWTVPVRSIEAAAAFCLRHAMEGMRPMAPAGLIRAWNDLIEGTVAAHA